MRDYLVCLFFAFNFNFYELGSILCWFCCISHFMRSCFFFLSWLQWLSSLFSIYIFEMIRSGNYIWFGLVFTIERHVEAYAFLPRRLYTFFDKILPYTNYIIFTKNKSLSMSKNISLNPSFLMIWYIHDISLRKLIQKKVYCLFFHFFEDFFFGAMCRNFFQMLGPEM